MTTVSVVVATYNWPAALDACLHALRRQTEVPREIIVADDGSGPDTRAVVERHQAASPCPVHHVWHPDEGFRLGGIRNKAMARAGGDYIVSLDGDMVCHPRCVEDHGRLRDPACFCQGSRIPLGPGASAVMTGRPGWWPSMLSRGVRRRARLARLPFAAVARLLNAPHRDPMTVRGCHQGFWRRDLLAVNGFNEAMWGWGREDNELAVRLGNHGRLRRNLRGVALACHLHHGEGDRRRLDENERILRETIDAGRVRCERGLDQWVGDPDAWDYRVSASGRVTAAANSPTRRALRDYRARHRRESRLLCCQGKCPRDGPST